MQWLTTGSLLHKNKIGIHSPDRSAHLGSYAGISGAIPWPFGSFGRFYGYFAAIPYMVGRAAVAFVHDKR